MNFKVNIKKLVFIVTPIILLGYLLCQYYIKSLEQKEAWQIPTLELSNILFSDDSEQYNYTIFDTNQVSFRSKSELAELYKATDFDIRELVALKPERLLLHEVITQTITKWRWNTTDELLTQIKLVVSYLKKSYQMQNLAKDSENYRNNIYIELNKKKDLDVSYIKKSYSPGRYINNYTIKQAALALQVDIKYNEYINPRIINLVNNYYEKLFKDNPNSQIKVDSNKKPRTVIIAGGPASGKTTYSRLMQFKLLHEGIEWQDVVKINVDYYKNLLALNNIKQNINPNINPNILFSQLVQLEAQMISNYRLKARVVELLKQRQIQFVLWDQVLVDPAKIEWGLLNNGTVSIHVISTDITNAIQRSYQRGKLTGRYEATEQVLNLHKRVTQELPEIINRFSGKNVYINILDNNNQKESLSKIFEVYNAQKYAVIYDSSKLISFISKLNMNSKIQSTKVEQDVNINIKEYFSILATNGYVIQSKD